jgi:DNA-binding transcriptional MerR regulator/copper chaperone CopZ
MKRFTISRAASAANVSIETIRFYERRGLIEQPPKPAGSGMREYDRDTLARIRFIRQAQDIGFGLREIAELLSLRADPNADCADIRTRAIGKREEVLAKLDRLARIRDALDVLIARCPGGGDVSGCSILEAMEEGGGEAGSPPNHATDTKKGTEEMKTTVFAVEGMHCDGCARTIEALLGRLPGVRKADASYEAREARVLHDRNQAAEADLIAAIAKGGFKAKVTGP